ncbi:MAG: hypothetical protein A2Z83_01880 [Omnitrophica bacterium GWA2_52_8]|nr:MAG: hypothetical protein A2Z83_01880 [Omnitrophica bacterium GWA2_52_8]
MFCKPSEPCLTPFRRKRGNHRPVSSAAVLEASGFFSPVFSSMKRIDKKTALDAWGCIQIFAPAF